jgi:uncharacterized ubiquitin-like protein YukD
MSMEKIFQDISKHMLKTTYNLKLNQLLKITLDFKKYMWQKLKLEKPNITTRVISTLNVTTMIKTRFEVDIATIKVDN